MLICQEIQETLNETEIVWNTTDNPLTPGLNTSMPDLRTDSAIVDNLEIMENLVEVDQISCLSIIDNHISWLGANNSKMLNSTYFGTSNNSAPKLIKKTVPGMVNMHNLPRALHGFAQLLKLTRGEEHKYVLYDLGSNLDTLKYNLDTLGKTTNIPLYTVIISHWHQDHTTEDIVQALEYIYSINGSQPITVVFSGGFENIPGNIDNEVMPFNSTLRSGAYFGPNNPSLSDLKTLETRGIITLLYGKGSRLILNGWLMVNDLLPPTTDDVAGGKSHVRTEQRPTTYNWMTKHKRVWKLPIDKTLLLQQPDDQVAEDLYAVCKVKNRGLGTISGCGHCGIVNILLDLISRGSLISQHIPLYFVMGGLHLDVLPDNLLKEVAYIIAKLVKDYNSSQPLLLFLGHCSVSRRVVRAFELFSDNKKVLDIELISCGSEQTFSS